MSSGYLKVILVGNLGADPEVRATPNGTQVGNLRVAATTRMKKGDNWEDHTEWVGVVCFGKTAENAGKYLAKGRQVFVEGRLQTREWTDKDGNKRWTTEVVAEQLLFLGGGAAGGGAQAGNQAPAPSDTEIPF